MFHVLKKQTCSNILKADLLFVCFLLSFTELKLILLGANEK